MSKVSDEPRYCKYKVLYPDLHTFHSVRKKRDDTKYFIEREDGAECEFEANNVHMGWYPHTEKELIECDLITQRFYFVKTSAIHESQKICVSKHWQTFVFPPQIPTSHQFIIITNDQGKEGK